MSDDLARQVDDLRAQLDGMRGDVRSVRNWQRQAERAGLLSRLASGPDPRRVTMGQLREPDIGTTSVYDTLGNVRSDIGKSNVLADPTLESFVAYPSVVIGTSETRMGAWAAHYVLNSGTAPTAIEMGMIFGRGSDADTSQVHSATVRPEMTFGTAAANIDIFLYPRSATDWLPSQVEALPFLVAAVRLVKRMVTTPANWAAITVTMQLLKDGVVVDESDPYDHLGAPDDVQRQLIASTQETPAAFKAAAWRWRVKIHIEKVVTGAPVLMASSSPRITEPLMHYSYTPDPLRYTPAVSNWRQGAINGPLILRSTLTPAQLTANQNDYAPAGYLEVSRLRLDSDASRTITGIAAGRRGNVLVLQNVGANPIVLAHENAGSVAANRFTAPGAVNYTIAAGAAVMVLYDETLARWVFIGPDFAASAVTATGQSYLPLNVTFDRSFDATSTTAAEVAHVLGTLITDLQSSGIID